MVAVLQLKHRKNPALPKAAGKAEGTSSSKTLRRA
jgi:hypothetical protein